MAIIDIYDHPVIWESFNRSRSLYNYSGHWIEKDREAENRLEKENSDLRKEIETLKGELEKMRKEKEELENNFNRFDLMLY